MAQKRGKKRRWLRALLFFTLTPLVIWFLAFILWFYWRDVTSLFYGKKTPVQATQKGPAPRENRPQEKIQDEERRKLEEILKERR